MRNWRDGDPSSTGVSPGLLSPSLDRQRGTTHLLRYRRYFRRGLAWRRGRDRESKPRVPALGPVLRREFPVALQVEITLKISHREQVSELRADAGDARLEVAQDRGNADVGGEVVIPIADAADLKLLGDELRGAPVDMHADAVLVVGIRIPEIVGEAEHRRELVPGLRIEVGVTAAAVDRPVPDAEIGEPAGVVRA